MTKKIDIKSLLIGFLLATSAMLFMGASSDNGNGRYQIASPPSGGIFLLDTKNAEMYHYYSSKKYFKKKTKDKNWIVR